MKSNIIEVFKNFIEHYNSIGYGEARVIETKRYIVIELWNAGFSENEDLESEFILNKKIKQYLILDKHPSKVFVIDKLMFNIFKHTKDEIFDSLRKTEHYSKKRKYKYQVEID